MPAYDEGFDPPAAIASVTLINPQTRKAYGNVLMLIDTGADVTLVPRSAIAKIRICIPQININLWDYDTIIS